MSVTLNLYDIMQNVLSESVDSNLVIDAIDNKYQVWINYSDEENHAPGRRLIEPYVYGISKAGNPIIRAFMWKGDSFRGAPRYETLRLDRIESWKPRKKHPFVTDPRTAGANVPSYNPNGDKSMTSIIRQVQFDEDGLYQPSLNAAKGGTTAAKNLGSVNVKKNDTSAYGEVPYNQIRFSALRRKGKYGGIDTDMVKKNIASTQRTRDEWDKLWKDVDDKMSQDQTTVNKSGPIADKHSNGGEKDDDDNNV